MRLLSAWSSGAVLVVAVTCGGCGGSLYDTPSDLTKGPVMTPTKAKMMEEAKAKYEAMKSKGKFQGAAKRSSP
jgi:hypothetical protein